MIIKPRGKEKFVDLKILKDIRKPRPEKKDEKNVWAPIYLPFILASV